MLLQLHNNAVIHIHDLGKKNSKNVLPTDSNILPLLPGVVTPFSKSLFLVGVFGGERPRDTVSRKQEATQVHRILQLRFFFLLLGTPLPLLAICRSALRFSSSPTATVIARLKMSSTPVISLLLHSMYEAPILEATCLPCSVVTGVRPWLRRSSIQFFLCRRSDFRPSKMIGVVGQK